MILIKFFKSKISAVKHNEKFEELLIYGIFGILTTCINFLSFEMLKMLFPTQNENILNTIAIGIAIVFAYITNRKYVFKSKSTNILKEFLSFFGSRMFSTLFEIVSFYILTTKYSINSTIAKLFITIFVVIINYLMSKIFVFKKKC